MSKPLQYFSDEYLERCRELTPEQIVNFLEQFRHIAYAGQKSTSKLISLKVPEDLLEAFKFKASLEGRPYQSIIKELMREWLSLSSN
jgi:predicted DNA binding CopG/RHH family protein